MRPMPPDTAHLSQAAYDRLSAELEELTGVGRVEIAKKIQAARELGDLKENGDYHAAKEEQGKMEGRIRQITSIVENCEIVEASATDTVQPGAIVEIRYVGDDDTEKYLLGSIEERHGDVDVMSAGSALGKKLVGAKVGAVVSYDTPTGSTLEVEVVGIE